MARGFMEKILWVDLSNRTIEVEVPDEELKRQYLGGFGIGAKLIWDRQPVGADPLGPDNIIGFLTGPVVGTAALFGTRYTVVAKSPLTNTWGDANSGGHFGPNLKFSGYDAVMLKGISENPVYLFIDNGKAEIRDAGLIWGQDTYKTEDILRSEHGPDTHVSCIGPAGEKLSLISCVINDKGRAAGRSGLGAVMGSKKLKAIAVRGKQKVPVQDEKQLRLLSKKFWKTVDGYYYNNFTKGGLCAFTEEFASIGDTPVKNWSGSMLDYPGLKNILAPEIRKEEESKYRCWHCPMGCGGHMKEGKGEYKYEAGVHKPEYETLGAFGPMCLNDNLASIIKANDICNRSGTDTISTGSTIAFAIECYEKGLITREDTDGIELGWGDHRAIIALAEKLVNREGIGDILADGVKVASEKIGQGSENFAIHCEGQEYPMHDPRCKHSKRFSGMYHEAPTPARHTVGSEGMYMPGINMPKFDPESWVGRGGAHRFAANLCHSVASAGFCFLGYLSMDTLATPELLSCVTGWHFDHQAMLEAGDRIVTIRHAWNLREGVNPKRWRVPDRILGNPPLPEGPNAGLGVPVSISVNEFFEAMDWDVGTSYPSQKRLHELGLDFIAQELYPPDSQAANR